jgi:hypothetical protein
MERESNITCLEDVAAYLLSCRPYKKQDIGCVMFMPGRMGDMSADVIAYFRSHPEHQVRSVEAIRFVTLHEKTIERINRQLPEKLQIDTGGRGVTARSR